MKKCITVLLFLFFTFCIATASYASETQKAESNDFKLQQASKALQITGAVKSLNEGAGTITVTKKFKDKTIDVIAVTDKETKIAKGKELKSLQDLKAGDKVVVVYTKKGEVNLAKSISLK
jgi:Cu/Ag efflux protein CusF